MKLNIALTLGDRLGMPNVKCLIDESIVLHEGPAAPDLAWEFDVMPGEHELIIVHYGKTTHDHVLDSNGSIAIDKFVQIESISIDDIKLHNQELWQGRFYPVYDPDYVRDQQVNGYQLPYYISPNLYLGHNGAWKWEFCYPFVPWIITQRRQGPQLEGTIFQTSQRILDEAKDFFANVPDI